ncbi:PREDICTED: syntenin-1-like [Dinoponera quadriceps]|uniref:Syntenin-1-like n=1 Tax=Dinoponera quadriceps TaxID=609295 RepID=A0A6P3XVK1_DINQU|nr:PREDICTED: syntenin-1-like [Dinoponera quadriceps]XP_014482556.1 PREDICTED: syntenin-1-like [Dinoponera quadriceps]
MSLYPTLEDMNVDHLMKAQAQIESQYALPKISSGPAIPSAPAEFPSMSPLYPNLEDLGLDYMGLELSEEAIARNMPEYTLATRQNMAVISPNETRNSLSGMIAPLSGQSMALQKAFVTNGIRELILCKDKDGKVGVRVHSVNNGVFVCLVSQNSPAAMAGLRFGDQILSINEVCVAGYSMDQVHTLFRNASINGIKVVIRDRPLERTVSMLKDSMGYVGFQFKNGKIIALIKDSSAARNGLLTDHQLLEINGKNVVGMKDKDITVEIENGGNIITVTVIPSYIYDHMVKKMSSSLLKNLMDHSALDL